MAKLFPSEKSDLEISISTHTIVRAILLVALAIILYGAISRSAHTLVWIGVAFFLSLALNAPVRWLSRHLPGKSRGSRTLATTISIGLILLFLGAFLAAIVPPLAKQTTNFIQGVPALVEDTRNGNGPIGHFVKSYNLESQVDKLSAQLSSRVGDIGGSALSTVTKIGSSVFATLTVIVLTIMMLTEGPRWRAIFVELIPVHRRHHVDKLSHDMNRVIQGYVNGQVTLAAIAAVLILPALFIAGASYPLALMVIVFICGLIPMVGHTIGAIIVTTVALFTSVPAAIIVLSYYILYQQIENYVVQPRIQANSTNMSPLLVFIAVILGVNFGGLLGGLVAIPVMGCARILLLDYLEQRNILSKKVVADAKTQGGAL